ncbi:hypothetical protein FOA52_006974 [Chlamydomonas sp. UWO 241]|nr:hypothetical protein FOA52_006974 [Chlamydomonas sp. UWO 241]
MRAEVARTEEAPPAAGAAAGAPQAPQPPMLPAQGRPGSSSELDRAPVGKKPLASAASASAMAAKIAAARTLARRLADERAAASLALEQGAPIEPEVMRTMEDASVAAAASAARADSVSRALKKADSGKVSLERLRAENDALKRLLMDLAASGADGGALGGLSRDKLEAVLSSGIGGEGPLSVSSLRDAVEAQSGVHSMDSVSTLDEVPIEQLAPEPEVTPVKKAQLPNAGIQIGYMIDGKLYTPEFRKDFLTTILPLFLYADDIALLAPSEEDLRTMLTLLDHICSDLALAINYDITVAQSLGHPSAHTVPSAPITIPSNSSSTPHLVHSTSKFKYLGSRRRNLVGGDGGGCGAEGGAAGAAPRPTLPALPLPRRRRRGPRPRARAPAAPAPPRRAAPPRAAPEARAPPPPPAPPAPPAPPPAAAAAASTVVPSPPVQQAVAPPPLPPPPAPAAVVAPQPPALSSLEEAAAAPLSRPVIAPSRRLPAYLLPPLESDMPALAAAATAAGQSTFAHPPAPVPVDGPVWLYYNRARGPLSGSSSPLQVKIGTNKWETVDVVDMAPVGPVLPGWWFICLELPYEIFRIDFVVQEAFAAPGFAEPAVDNNAYKDFQLAVTGGPSEASLLDMRVEALQQQDARRRSLLEAERVRLMRDIEAAVAGASQAAREAEAKRLDAGHRSRALAKAKASRPADLSDMRTANEVQGVWKWVGPLPKGGSPAMLAYNVHGGRLPSNQGPAPLLHLGYNNWAVKPPRPFAMARMRDAQREHQLSNGEWWGCQVDVPREAATIDFVVSDGNKSNWDNNGGSDYHTRVEAVQSDEALAEMLYKDSVAASAADDAARCENKAMQAENFEA